MKTWFSSAKALLPFVGAGLFSFVAVLVLDSCSSLEHSEFDQNFRMQGTYSCEKFSHESPNIHEKPAEADLPRVRCARDEWKVMKDKVIFTRSLFLTPGCDTILGRITFTRPLAQSGEVLEVSHPNCQVIRKNPLWLAEGAGRCMLNKMKLDTGYDVGVLRECKNYVPSFCETSHPVQITGAGEVKGREPYPDLKFEPVDGKAVTCTRYTH